MAAFGAEEPTNPPGGPGRPHIACRAGTGQSIVAFHHPFDQIDLAKGGRVRLLDTGGHVDRPELATDTTGEHPRHIGVIVRERARRIGSIEVTVGLGEQLPRQVVVSVHHREVGVYTKRLGVVVGHAVQSTWAGWADEGCRPAVPPAMVCPLRFPPSAGGEPRRVEVRPWEVVEEAEGSAPSRDIHPIRLR